MSYCVIVAQASAFDKFFIVESDDPRESSIPINAVKIISAGSSMKTFKDVLGSA